MPGLHLRTDHVFRLGGSLAFPRGGFVVLECGGRHERRCWVSSGTGVGQCDFGFVNGKS
jgi:hypothetical protein